MFSEENELTPAITTLKKVPSECLTILSDGEQFVRVVRDIIKVGDPGCKYIAGLKSPEKFKIMVEMFPREHELEQAITKLVKIPVKLFIELENDQFNIAARELVAMPEDYYEYIIELGRKKKFQSMIKIFSKDGELSRTIMKLIKIPVDFFVSFHDGEFANVVKELSLMSEDNCVYITKLGQVGFQSMVKMFLNSSLSNGIDGVMKRVPVGFFKSVQTENHFCTVIEKIMVFSVEQLQLELMYFQILMGMPLNHCKILASLSPIKFQKIVKEAQNENFEDIIKIVHSDVAVTKLEMFNDDEIDKLETQAFLNIISSYSINLESDCGYLKRFLTYYRGPRLSLVDVTDILRMEKNGLENVGEGKRGEVVLKWLQGFPEDDIKTEVVKWLQKIQTPENAVMLRDVLDQVKTNHTTHLSSEVIDELQSDINCFLNPVSVEDLIKYIHDGWMSTVISGMSDGEVNNVVKLWVDALYEQDGSSKSVLKTYLDYWVVRTFLRSGHDVFRGIYDKGESCGKWQNQFFKTTIGDIFYDIRNGITRIGQGKIEKVSKGSIIIWLLNQAPETIVEWINVEREKRLAFLKVLKNTVNDTFVQSIELSEEEIAFLRGQISQAKALLLVPA
jgi:hypothetical protein